MSSRKFLWASLAVAMLGCGPLLNAEDFAGVPPSTAQSPAALKEAGAPIPLSPDAKTQADLLRQYLDWHKRFLLPPLQAAVKGKPWEAAAVKFAEDSFAAWAGIDQEGTEEAWAGLVARGDALIHGGCDELTVRYLTARARYEQTHDRTAANAEYRPILSATEKDRRYPKALACMVAVSLRGALPSPGAAIDKKVIELWRQSFEEGSYSGADDTLFMNGIDSVSEVLKRNLDAMEKLATGLQSLPEWARETILGKIEVQRAWRSRGNGWANSVTDKGWKGFADSLTKARGHLEAAWKLRPDQPYAAAEMITVVMGSGHEPDEGLRVWFDRAVKARFDYAKAYSAYTWAIRPRWGGSHEEMLAFGRACAATQRYDTNVPRHLIKVIDDIGKELSMRREIYETPSIAKDVLALDKAYAASASPDSANTRISNLLLDAWLCRQWDEAKAALDRLPDQKLSRDLRGRLAAFGTDRTNVVGETLIYAGPAREDYVKAKELEDAEIFEEAAAHYATALKTCGDLPAPRELITLFTKINDTRVEMENGQWKEISPKAADYSDWGLSEDAKCSIPEDGVLQIIGKGETTQSRWRRPVGENYEVRATFEFLPPQDKAHLFAIILGESPRAPEESVTCQFYSDRRTKGKVNVLHGFTNTNNPLFDVELGMKNRLLVQCWQGRLNLYLNGKAVFEGLQSAEGVPGDYYGEIGFGGYKLSADEGFRVSGVAVRSLKSEPAPPDDAEDK